ncbi:hypothetical protein RCC89_19505 [Cytophagaceae bacterium ABcell3]|nr:hypothetical protein RCC89_19425 [Cytophagaceae bacterium ABcell3]WMJ75318.1 hypothetical protein RCC89_19455 [Cytophagaceae bacterium ABcell3]WMJ75328.1 hypothetical protein RCC89_19505 [Cytophagaceae bacterium ABcell3]
MGNIQGLQHIATGGNFTRSFQYSPEKNILEDITIGQTAYGFNLNFVIDFVMRGKITINQRI